jgi:hypothetical protein
LAISQLAGARRSGAPARREAIPDCLEGLSRPFGTVLERGDGIAVIRTG